MTLPLPLSTNQPASHIRRRASSISVAFDQTEHIYKDELITFLDLKGEHTHKPIAPTSLLFISTCTGKLVFCFLDAE